MRGGYASGMASGDLCMQGSTLREKALNPLMGAAIGFSRISWRSTTSYNSVRPFLFLAHTAGQDRLSWSIWLYKDIGFQGMVYISQSTPYFQLFEKFLAKKHRLAVDAWGADDSVVKDVYDPLLKLIVDEIDPKYRNLYPYPVWKLSDRVGRLARNILVTEFLVKEWADHFIGHDSEEELEKIAASFKYENCVKREGLNNILTENAQ